MRGKRILKSIANIPLRPFDLEIKRRTKQVEQKPDPSLYSTLDDPMEVPCQKETYFLALNKYVSQGDNVLDVGCGLGYGMNILSIKAGAVRGLDVDQRSVDFCKQSLIGKNPKLLSVDLYDGYQTSFKDKEFDVVTCVDVLEHVKDYDRFIDELLRITKKAVIISTPNRRPEYTNPDGTPKNYWHLREWDYQELDKILKKHRTRIDWHLLNGAWDGPFEVTKKPNEDTLALVPVLRPAKR